MVEPGQGAASYPERGDSLAPVSVQELLNLADLEQAAANYESAIRTYRRALDLDASLVDKAKALTGIGSCLERVGRWKEAQNVLEDAAQAALAAGDELELGRVHIKLGKIHLGQGRLDTALELGQSAIRLIGKSDPSARGFALNLLGTAHNFKGDPETSARCFEEALSAFKGAGDIRSLSLAYNNLGLIYKQKCEWQRALEYLQVASSLQAIEGDYPERRAGLHNLGLVHYRMGHWDRARECFTESLAISRQVNDPLGVIRGLLASAGVDIAQRRWADALVALEQALELGSEERYPQETALTYRSLGQLHQARGELARARRCFEVAWKKAIEISEEGDLVCELLRLRAELALIEGHVPDAASLAQRAVELSSRRGDRMETALAQITLGRVLLADGNVEGYERFVSAHEVLRRLGSPFPRAQALLDEGRLRVAARRDWERAEAVLVEALGVLRGLGLPELETEALVALAGAASGRGELSRAGDILEQARRVSQDLQDPSTLALLAGVQKELETQLVETSVTTLGAYRTAGRLEEVIDSRRPYANKLYDVLEIVAQALEADGAAFIFASAETPSVTYRVGAAPAARLARTIRDHRPERPEIVLDAASAPREPWGEMATLRQAGSLLVVPVYQTGGTAWLYLDRLRERNRGAFGQSQLSLCLALVPQIEALLDRSALETATTTDEDSLHRRTFLADVVTQNPEMIEILKLVEKVNRTELTVLLQGETGTGKTLIARAIHLSSHRAHGSFVTVDCAALPENLLESELFGYMKGSFTGAVHDKKGLFEEADGGTIFLDEVGRAGLGVQRRLLHLLDKGEVRPVGSTSYRKLNVRVICATSAKDLLSAQEHGPFIKDLYYRLNDIIIRVPPLRERPEDIPLLAEYFLETLGTQTGRTCPGFSRAAMQRVVRYAWPGNVRELEKVVRRAAILADDGETIGIEHLPRELLAATERQNGNGRHHDDFKATVEDTERRLVQDALTKHAWNKTRAAKELGLSRKGLKNKITRYGLKPQTP
jgi:two-component system, NtrC family, response regulator HupR/HoxA